MTKCTALTIGLEVWVSPGVKGRVMGLMANGMVAVLPDGFGHRDFVLVAREKLEPVEKAQDSKGSRGAP